MTIKETPEQEVNAIRRHIEARVALYFSPDDALLFSNAVDACAEAGLWEAAQQLCQAKIRELDEYKRACGYGLRFD